MPPKLRATVTFVLAIVSSAICTTTANAAIAPQVTGSQSNSCAISDVGALYCWGSNQWGELGRADGVGTTDPNPAPAPVQGLPAVKRVATSASFTCALTESGRVHCWGVNFSGEQGNTTNNGAFVADYSPQEVAGLPDATDVDTGIEHTCALTVAGAVYCWGNNGKGQIGTATNYGVNTANPSPAPVVLPAAASDIEVGALHTCALLVTGATYCWGMNENGQLGNVSGSGTTGGTYTPLLSSLGVARLLDSPSYSQYHSCGVLADDTLSCWGHNGNGQLGVATNLATTVPNPSAAVVGGLGPVLSAATGPNDTCALLANRTLSCFGMSEYGQLGVVHNESSTPTTVGADNVFAVGLGLWHSCFAQRGGTVRCMGTNFAGQLGNANGTGVVSTNATPTAVAGLDLVTLPYPPVSTTLRKNSTHVVRRGRTVNTPLTFLMQPDPIVDPSQACNGTVTFAAKYRQRRKVEKIKRRANLALTSVAGVETCVARRLVKLPFKRVRRKLQTFEASFPGNESVSVTGAKTKIRMPRR